MRTVLMRTTALLACLNLALPLPALAQNGGGKNAKAAEACADPNAPGCPGAGKAKGKAKQAGGGQDKGGKKAKGEGGGQKPSNEAKAAPKPAEAPAKADKPRKAAQGGGGSAGQGKAGNQAEAAPKQQKADGSGKNAGKPRDAEAEDKPKQAGNAGAGEQPKKPKPVAGAAGGSAAGDGADGQATDGAVGAAVGAASADDDAGGKAPGAKNDRAKKDKADAPAKAARDADTQNDGAAKSRKAETDTGEDGRKAKPGKSGGETARSGDAEPQQGDQRRNAGNEGEKPEKRRSGAARRAAEGGAARGAAANADAKARDVSSEKVTEQNSRSSREEFQTDISREARAKKDDDGGGLSKLEKALLLGAGALAVGAVLRGNREVVASSGDRVVTYGEDGGYRLLKDDNALLARPGTEVQTETFDDGSTRSTVLRQDGSRIVTIRDADLRVLRRTRIAPDGQSYLLIDDTRDVQPVDVATLQPTEPRFGGSDAQNEEALRQALAAAQGLDRSFSLAQVRDIAEVRTLVPAIDLDNITFESGSAAISPDEADELTELGETLSDLIAEDPREIFLVEGHTDAVGDPAYNLALSDRRAESVALALTEYFDVPPENLVVQGYGEEFLKIATDADERQNRRATIRRITPLLQVAAAN